MIDLIYEYLGEFFMKSVLKFFAWGALSLFIIIEICFLFVLPNMVDINSYKADIQKIVKEQAKLNLSFDNAKIITTPLFSAGAEITDIKVTMEDGSVLFTSDKVRTKIALPSLLLLTIKVSCFDVENPFINLEVAKNDFKLLSLIENIINEQKAVLQTENPAPEPELPLGIKTSQIKIKVPAVKLKNYKVLITDLNTKHYLNLNGEELKFGYFNGKSVKIKTEAGLYSDENKNISLNLDINSAIPVLGTQLDEEDDKAQLVDIPFFNPVEAYRTYDFKANVDANLRIRHSAEKGFSAYGYFNADNVTLNIEGLQLPESYLRANMFGKNVWLDTVLKLDENEKMALAGRIKHGNRPFMDMNINTDKIYIQNLLDMTKALLASFDIPNELSNYSAGGYFQANSYIKTNFKKLKSYGKINIKEVYLAIKGIGKVLSDTDINIILDDNSLDIKNSSFKLGGAKIWANGGIDDKSIADITIKSEPILLSGLYNAFAPKDIKKAFKLSNGKLTLDLAVKGKLKDAFSDTKFVLENLKLSDASGLFVLENGSLSGKATISPKDFSANLINKNFAFSLPKSNSKIVAKNAQINIDSKDVKIAENTVSLNDNSLIKYRGEVINYPKLESINFSADGNLSTSDLIKFIGSELGIYLHNNGAVPVNVSLTGTSEKQTLKARLLSNSNNFITPVDFAELNGKDIVWQTIIDFKRRHQKIKDTGAYIRTISHDENGNEIENLKPIANIEGTLVGTRINRLGLKLHNELSGKIFVFPNSSLTIKPVGINIFGQTYDPRFLGGITVENISIPELMTNIESIKLKLLGQRADFRLDNVLVNGSDIKISGIVDLILSNIINIRDVVVTSKFIDVDRLLKVADSASKYVPTSAASSAASSQSADIPIKMSGAINLAKIKTGEIKVDDVTSQIALNNNIFYIEKLKAKIFDGKVNGTISMNLLSSLLDIKVKGDGINMDKMLSDAANMKGMLSGKTSFDADISLKGATFEEQVKSLKGSVEFLVKDGQYGPFGKLENLIIAENIRESEIFKNALGGIIDGIATIDTAHFQTLKGKVSFLDGICRIDEIISEGKILALHLFGDFNILKNTVDMKVRAKMSSVVSNLLGPIGMINPANLMSSAMGMNVVTAKAFSVFCETLTPEASKTLPSFENKYVDNSAMKFQLVVRGDVAKPLSLVKSFKWLATQDEINKAQEFVNSIPEPIEGSTATTVEEIIAERKALEAEKQTLKYKIKHLFSKENKKVKIPVQNEEIKEEKN